ncbi:hypothetical protein [Serratia marcescens]|uniref:hypothetical protein n=1 Tax=Serratia marcescens TaxID=615 RepID=UPI0011261AE6|nr:hypothetical protein [Serratia marcescens]MDS0777888.1 hypothetical protein [Serratia marcescens]TPV64968.1 hypothetical protein FJ699_18645 [Serratia marcescens]HEP0386743.1 hypothetical protein [Serratia marcescens]
MKIKLLTILLLSLPLVSYGNNKHGSDLSKRCALALSEVNEVGELTNSFLDPWLKKGLLTEGINFQDFAKDRVSNFNKQYAQIKNLYQQDVSSNYDDPVSKSNDLTVRSLFTVNAFQKYAADGDKAALKSSWAVQHKAMKEDLADLRKLCAKSGQ